jgi:hypothetical protein
VQWTLDIVQEVLVDIDHFAGVAWHLCLGVAVRVAGVGLLVPEAGHVLMYCI